MQKESRIYCKAEYSLRDLRDGLKLTNKKVDGQIMTPLLETALKGFLKHLVKEDGSDAIPINTFFYGAALTLKKRIVIIYGNFNEITKNQHSANLFMVAKIQFECNSKSVLNYFYGKFLDYIAVQNLNELVKASKRELKRQMKKNEPYYFSPAFCRFYSLNKRYRWKEN